MSNAELNLGNNKLSIKQTFEAPIARVFACFTQPELLTQWHSPSDVMTIDAEIDLCPGGQYRIGMTGEDGTPHVAIGQYHEIEAPVRLVYSWSWEGGDGPETMITVLFTDQGDQTEVELIHTGFEQQDEAEHHSQGWGGIFTRLENHLQS